MDKRAMGSFIAALRRAKGLTQRELAELLNVSDKAVSRWERGDAAPDLSVIPALAELFGVTADELLRGERRPDLGEGFSWLGAARREWLIKSAMTKLNIRTVISLGLALFGFAVLSVCLVKPEMVYEPWGYPAWILAALAFIAAAVVQAASLTAAFSAADVPERSEDVLAFRRRAYLSSCAPLLAALTGLGADAASLLLSITYGSSATVYGVLVVAALALIIGVIAAACVYSALGLTPSRD